MALANEQPKITRPSDSRNQMVQFQYGLVSNRTSVVVSNNTGTATTSYTANALHPVRYCTRRLTRLRDPFRSPMHSATSFLSHGVNQYEDGQGYDQNGNMNYDGVTGLYTSDSPADPLGVRPLLPAGSGGDETADLLTAPGFLVWQSGHPSQFRHPSVCKLPIR